MILFEGRKPTDTESLLTKQRTTTACPPAGVDAVAVRGGPYDVRRGHRELAEVLQQRVVIVDFGFAHVMMPQWHYAFIYNISRSSCLIKNYAQSITTLQKGSMSIKGKKGKT